MCRRSPGRYRTERGTVVLGRAAEVVVEVGSGPWWFTLVLAITIAIRLIWAIRASIKRDKDDRETP